MGEAENTKRVQELYGAFGSGDMDTLLAGFEDNIQWITQENKLIPPAKIRRGKAETTGFFTDLAEYFDFEKFEPSTFTAQDNRVLVQGQSRVRVKKTNKVVEFEWVHAFTLNNNQITKFHEYFDTSPVAEAFKE